MDTAIINAKSLDIDLSSGNQHSIKINKISAIEHDTRDHVVFVYIGSNRIKIEQNNITDSGTLFINLKAAITNAI